MPRLSEEESVGSVPSFLLTPSETNDQSLPSLTVPSSFKNKKAKRRCIINSLVESENGYIASLQKLVYEYKGYLETTSTPILSASKVETLFYRVTELLACHLQFRENLRSVIENWEQEERIGEVFVTSFSNPMVLETYAAYINNFNNAMEVAKSEAKRKSAFADFLKVKQLQSLDRLNLFGLMVKPIQRFPQFIMLVQDLLKETPPGHTDRMHIQQALTTLECLTGMLNERKRISEQSAAFKTNFRGITNKLGRSEDERTLIRADEVRQLEFNQQGQVSRAKQRKLLLLNDSVVCVSVSGRTTTEIDFSNPGTQERLNFKWSALYSEIEVVDGPAHGTLARLTAGGSVYGKRSSLGRSSNPASLLQFNGVESGQAENLAQEMGDLMHDYDVMSRISSLLDTMKCTYPIMTTQAAGDILNQIQTSIRQKDEEMSYMDKCCLHLALRKKDRTETITFQMQTPRMKDEWIVELRLARLAVEPSNSPSWNLKSDLLQPVTKFPLYVKNMVANSDDKLQTEVTCGVSYTLMVPTPTRTLKPVTYIWVNCADLQQTDSSSSLRVYSAQKTQQVNIRELGTVVPPCPVNALLYVPKAPGPVPNSLTDRRTDQVWMAGKDKSINIYTALEPEKGRELGQVFLLAEPLSMLYHHGTIWVGLSDGTLYIYRRGLGGLWDTNCPQVLLIGSEPLSSLTLGAGVVYAASGHRVAVVEIDTMEVERNFNVTESEVPGAGAADSRITFTALSGVGLWVAVSGCSHVGLYHTETLAHVSNVDLEENVSRVLSSRDSRRRRPVTVTSLAVSTGLLWIGTNVGLALTLPLPRLGGVPNISGSANISFHAHFGPVRVFLPIVQSLVSEEATPITKKMFRLSTTSQDTIEEEPCTTPEKTLVQKLSSMEKVGLTKRYTSPRIPARQREPLIRKTSESLVTERRGSKTLPRGFSMANQAECRDSIYGLYEDLLNVQDYDCESGELHRSRHNCHKSDPELNTIPYRVSTLDRRMTMKLQRPRSLDLSSWSVESRCSSQTNSSSDGSEKAVSPSVSRNASFLSQRSSTAGEGGPGSTVTVSRNQSVRRPTKAKSEISHRTVTTLMGGRGYINLGASSPANKLNNKDACLVVWDQKV